MSLVVRQGETYKKHRWTQIRVKRDSQDQVGRKVKATADDEAYQGETDSQKAKSADRNQLPSADRMRNQNQGRGRGDG